jgi:hypothetical protein
MHSPDQIERPVIYQDKKNTFPATAAAAAAIKTSTHTHIHTYIHTYMHSPDQIERPVIYQDKKNTFPATAAAAAAAIKTNKGSSSSTNSALEDDKQDLPSHVTTPLTTLKPLQQPGSTTLGPGWISTRPGKSGSVSVAPGLKKGDMTKSTVIEYSKPDKMSDSETSHASSRPGLASPARPEREPESESEPGTGKNNGWVSTSIGGKVGANMHVVKNSGSEVEHVPMVPVRSSKGSP